ncbi:sensor histidine kinase [Nonomuraea sp. B5E05]|uniref:sensor histidine kinase n=1 Tax=Nonomuraea sp. B5E05 TaxID=3153569 RepID=UPI0032613616
MRRAGGRRVAWVRRIPAACTALAPYAPLATGLLVALVAVAESLAFSSTQPVTGDTVSVPAGTPYGPAGTLVNVPPTADPTGPGERGAGPWVPGPAQLIVLPLLALATTLPLPLLWAQPLAGALVACAAAVMSIAAFDTFTVAGAVTQLIAAYRSGRHGSPVPAVLAVAPFPLLAVALAAAGRTDGQAWMLALLAACTAPAAALAGIARRARRRAMADTAARQVMSESLLEHAARGERARIARELHDVVAHHISMVAVQAETARLAVPGMPDAGAERLLAIGDTARAALTEMRRLLGVLREDAEAEPAWRPQPGLRLHELNELLDASREASGTVTRLVLRGAPVELDPGVELAAYRIVQEALTNVRRHAPGAAVDVELDYGDEVVRLRVRDNGPGPPSNEPGNEPDDEPGDEQGGHGLSGMRERAAAVGADLHAGPAPGGGFLVEARLPRSDERLSGKERPSG